MYVHNIHEGGQLVIQVHNCIKIIWVNNHFKTSSLYVCMYYVKMKI